MPGLMPRVRRHLRERAALFAVCAAVAVVARCASPAPPERSAAAIARLLGGAVGGQVDPDEFVWEAGGGLLRDAFVGRRVLFLARRAGENRDLYRARVRLTRAGRALAVGGVVDLSRTPDGDESDLTARGTRAAYVTRAQGVVQGATLIDLAGEGDTRAASTRLARLWASIESFVATGSLGGARFVDITFAHAPSDVRIELAEPGLVLALGDEGTAAAVDAGSASTTIAEPDRYGIFAQLRRHGVRPAVRALPELLERADMPAAASALARFTRRFPHRTTTSARGVAPTRPAGDGGFPPPPLADGDDGAWRSRVAAADADPLAVEIAVRPGAGDSDAVVRLVAFDTRRVDLAFVPGLDDPPTTTGPRPRATSANLDAARVVAVVALGARGGAGASQHGRVLAPLLADRPTLVADPVLGASLGPWRGAAPPQSSVRQFSAWLVAVGDDAPVTRSALCRTRGGHLVVAWSPRARAAAMVRALESAGCADSVELARAPESSGVAIAGDGGLAPLDDSMTFRPSPLDSPAAEDRLVVVRRDAAPSGEGWRVAPGLQPEPAWLPAIHERRVAKLGAEVTVTSFAPGRFSWSLRAGSRELRPRGAAAKQRFASSLDPAQASAVVASVGVGTARKRSPRGLIVEGLAGLRIRPDEGALVLDSDGDRARGKLELVPSSAVPDGVDASELPLTAEGGELRAEGREVGARRERAALCVLADGMVLVATSTFDSDEPTTQALLEAGCTRVAALDRGAHDPVSLRRAGVEPGPEASSETTTLFALPVVAMGRLGR